VSDILDRVFGPDPDNTTFPPFNAAKVIPIHDCVWAEVRSWGTVFIQCPVCKSQPPERRAAS
jgi:hypothetical protein